MRQDVTQETKYMSGACFSTGGGVNVSINVAGIALLAIIEKDYTLGIFQRNIKNI